jgi:ketosteroid isomerase-like protein
MSQENVEIVRRSVAAFNEGGIEAVAQFAHPEIEFQEPPTQPAPRAARGVEETRETFTSFDEAWEEHQSEIKEIRELPGEEVLLSTVEHFRGRDGMELAAACWTVYTFREGKIIKLRPFWDRAQAFEAAGVSEQATSEEGTR